VGSLTPIAPMSVRLRAWEEVSVKELGWHRFDVAENYERLLSMIGEYQPDAVVHFAEQVVSRFLDPAN
jgi:UDP-sulfoquinovose synthase